jgi:hypothetical protein
MAHGLEARVPFLDREVIQWAMRVPPAAKGTGSGRPEKALLREAFTGWLPEDLLWRDKAEFGDGSGARDVLSAAVEADITDAELAAEREAVVPAAAHEGGGRVLPDLPRAPPRRARRGGDQPVRAGLSHRPSSSSAHR